mgnify:CR=1 FL=1
MRLDLSEIVKNDGASLEVQVQETISELNELVDDVTFNQPVRFNGKLVNISGILKLEGHMETGYNTKCFRCLLDLNGTLSVDVKEDIIDGRTNPDSETYTYEGNFFEIDKLIKDYVLLNLPVRHVCDEDCKGLCYKCGSNLNVAACECKEETINPQMEALKDFFKN